MNLALLTKEQYEKALTKDRRDWSVEKKRIFLRSRAYYDIEWFAYHVTKRWTTDKATGQRFKVPDFHKELWKLAELIEKLGIILPRGFGKTTAMAKILVLWLLLFEKEKSILLIMQKGLGEEVIGDIRRELETNPLIQFIWGKVVPIRNPEDRTTEKWRQRHLQLLNGTEVKTITRNEPVRGNRPTMILGDDLEENKDIKNPVMADETYNWFFTSVYPSLNPGGHVIVLGTIIGGNCFINRLKQESKERGFTMIEFPAIKDFNPESFTGNSLWPERFPLPALKAIYDTITKRRFMQEFMNEPFVLNGSPVFDEEGIGNLEIIEPKDTQKEVHFYIESSVQNQVERVYPLGLELVIGVDTAHGNIDGDYSVITGRDIQLNLIFQFRGHMTQDRLATLLDWIMHIFPNSFIVPEANDSLAFLMKCREYEWTDRIYKRKKFDQITMKEKREWGWHTGPTTKPLMINELDQTIRNVGGILPTGKFQVSKESYDEYTHYYNGEDGMNALAPWHDDSIIADALIVQGIKRGHSQPGIAF